MVELGARAAAAISSGVEMAPQGPSGSPLAGVRQDGPARQPGDAVEVPGPLVRPAGWALGKVEALWVEELEGAPFVVLPPVWQDPLRASRHAADPQSPRHTTVPERYRGFSRSHAPHQRLQRPR
jgi:hypothetical protein